MARPPVEPAPGSAPARSPSPPLRGVLSRVAERFSWSPPSCSRRAFAAADTVAVTIRSGNHPDFGRIVFDAPPHMPYHVVRDGDHLTVTFAGDAALAGDPRLPRNIKGLQADHARPC